MSIRNGLSRLDGRWPCAPLYVSRLCLASDYLDRKDPYPRYCSISEYNPEILFLGDCNVFVGVVIAQPVSYRCQQI